MNNNVLNITYASSLTKFSEVNSSFDSGVLRVAYHGKNRNKTFISKEAFEKAIPSIYNCPVVCNYDRETNSIGAHDVDIVSSEKGMKIVNITQPVGLIPESASYWWETVTEENGEQHEYLYITVLIWKRQEAYAKIKENGITDESMEITVKSGSMKDDYYCIDNFEFTAFCLLESAEPCFESASLSLYSVNTFRDEYTKMMNDFKECFSQVNTSTEGDINTDNNVEDFSKGGESALDKTKLLEEYGVTVDSLDFSIEELSVEELREKLDEMKNKNDFSLTASQLTDEIWTSLESVKYTDPYRGECRKYFYCDHNPDRNEVYCYDGEDDWKLYGFKYSMNGDHVVIDFDSKTRKKLDYIDFDEGDTGFTYGRVFELIKEDVIKFKDNEISEIKADLESKYNKATEDIANLESELSTLREYKITKENEEREANIANVFNDFNYLAGVEAFDKLCEDHANMTIAEIESKCYEIKGRYTEVNTPTKFSKETAGSVRLPIEKKEKAADSEPYGGLFKQFPPKK